MKRIFNVFVYSRGITKDMLDELGHANYNEQKKIFEVVRFRFCHYLGFRRSVLQKMLGLAFVMREDKYEYLRQLKLGDNISFLINIEVDGPAQVTITLKGLRHRISDEDIIGNLATTATYKMVMVNLKTEKPTRIPKPILRSIERWHEDQKLLKGTFERQQAPQESTTLT